MRLALAEILAGKASLRGFVGRLKANGFYDVLDLIGNQPQLEFRGQLPFANGSGRPERVQCHRCPSKMGGKSYNDYIDTAAAWGIQPAWPTTWVRIPTPKKRTRRAGSGCSPTTRRSSRLTFAMPQPGFSFLTEPSRAAVGDLAPMAISRRRERRRSAQPRRREPDVRGLQRRPAPTGSRGGHGDAHVSADAGVLSIARGAVCDETRVSRRCGPGDRWRGRA